MQKSAHVQVLRDKIERLLDQRGLTEPCFVMMLDYVVELFTTQGLGSDYYGYHNIDHELEVTYVTLLATDAHAINAFTLEDVKYLYVGSLFHDFDPQKSIDKPHEENVIKFITHDEKLRQFLNAAKIDLEILTVLILRTAYPWEGSMKADMMKKINECFARSELTRDNKQYQEHIMHVGHCLSVIDRIGGYALGNFAKGLEMAKMNAHALGWQPSVIVRNSVMYFERLLADETMICKMILKNLPRQMRKNFFDTILSFMKIRQQEISIQADVVYENLKLIPTIDSSSTRQDYEFIESLRAIFLELPRPLQFMGDCFGQSIKNPETILVTLRLNTSDGDIVGFAKGGPLERYSLKPGIKDANFGLYNTVFLEPIALKMGYWGLKGGSSIRYTFMMQALAKKFTNLTGFAMRELITAKADSENAEIVTRFDPERLDYYRIRLESFQ